jgi:hypothetical protein
LGYWNTDAKHKIAGHYWKLLGGQDCQKLAKHFPETLGPFPSDSTKSVVLLEGMGFLLR